MSQATLTAPAIAAPCSEAPRDALSAEQIEQLRSAQQRYKKIRTAIGMAKGDAWTTGLFGAITLVTSLTSIPGFARGAALLARSYVAHPAGRKRRELDPAAARTLGYNQLAFAAVLMIYA